MVVENLDASMVISPPQVDELLASYKAIERESQLNLRLATSSAQQLDSTGTTPMVSVASSSASQEEKVQEVEYADPFFKSRRDHLEMICSSVSSTVKICHAKLNQNGIPAFYERQWILCAGVGALTCLGAWRFFANWTWLKNQAIETKNGITRFLYDHAVVPVVSIYKTIRYEDTEVSVMSRQNLEEDVESLVRMVKDFHIEKHGGADQLLLENLSNQARSGVIPSIMTAYESEIPHPIANALAGDLLRLALIQVQKQKVDIEKAMAQLDRLLKQNEINFQLMALFPVILASAGLAILSSRSNRDPYKSQHAAIRSLLRRVAMHINKSSLDEKTQNLDFLSTAASTETTPWGTSSIPKTNLSPRGVRQENAGNGPAAPSASLESSNASSSLHMQGSSLKMNHEDYGLLLSLVSQLYEVGVTLPWQERMGFIEDVAELAKCHFTARQRLATIQRMYTNYSFLSASS
jgi:nuclear-control-of-ATPase protein 2